MIHEFKKQMKSRLRNVARSVKLTESFFSGGAIGLGPSSMSGDYSFPTNRKTGKILLELDYPPSRDYRPRWGNTHPPHAALSRMFDKNRTDHLEILSQLGALQPYFSKIRPDFVGPEQREAGWVGGPINALDTALLYYFVQKYKPKIYLEIGSGVTTLFAARAKLDHALSTKIISIDPLPRAAVDVVCDQ